MRKFKKVETMEAVDILQEECAEVIQIASKIKRFGIDSVSPYTGETNKEILQRELGDLTAMMVILSEMLDLDEDKIFEGVLSKMKKLKEFSKLPDDLLDSMICEGEDI